MRNISYLIFLIALALISSSCKEFSTGSRIENLPPETKIFLFPDSGTTISKQKSKLTVHWWGDDPDGIVIGYYIKWGDEPWKFTQKTDSTFTLAIVGSDTNYTFSVCAVDNFGDGFYNQNVIRNGIDFGPEPFEDDNLNDSLDPGEKFIDIGAIDPTPAEFTFPIKNSPPLISFLKNSEVPETTFTVASFAWSTEDLDGNETIDKIYVALNDTTNFVELPGYTNFITIKAKPPFYSDTVSADIYIGTNIKQPYSIKLNNLRLNNLNKLYVKAKDIAGAFSETIVMPSSERTWFVKKQKGKILIIDDYTILDNAENFYKSMLDSLLNGAFIDKYDVLNIRYGSTSTTPGILLPKFINPTFTETLNLFDLVVWFTDNNPSLDVAQLSIRNYVEKGGKILLSMIFPQNFDTRGLSDFLPIDSVSSTPINFIPFNTPINLTSEGTNLGYPKLQRDGYGTVARIRTFYPSVGGAIPLYTIGMTGNPIIGFKDTDTRKVFIGLPLHRLNGGPSNVKKFLEKVILDEFGVTP